MTWLVIPPAALVMLLPVPSAAQSIVTAHSMTIDPSHVRKRSRIARILAAYGAPATRAAA